MSKKKTTVETGITVTLTRDDMIKDLKPLLADSIKDMVDAFLTDPESCESPKAVRIDRTLHGVLSGAPGRDGELIKFWQDCLSDWYFHNHPEVTEVLFLRQAGNENFTIPVVKEWLATRKSATKTGETA